MKKQKISDAVIHRLPRYYRYLDDLYNKGVVRISSNSLGAKMDITASQIRQDLSCFGEFGQQGYGYNVAELRAEIGHILGIDSGHRIIVVGVGHLGHALLQNFDFEKVGFRIDSAFDVSPALIGTEIRGVTVHSMDELEDYVASYHPNVAVLTVPQSVAQPLADRLIGLGVRGLHVVVILQQVYQLVNFFNNLKAKNFLYIAARRWYSSRAVSDNRICARSSAG
jgi:redox-sensing transcriptional repressor